MYGDFTSDTYEFNAVDAVHLYNTTNLHRYRKKKRISIDNELQEKLKADVIAMVPLKKADTHGW